MGLGVCEEDMVAAVIFQEGVPKSFKSLIAELLLATAGCDSLRYELH